MAQINHKCHKCAVVSKHSAVHYTAKLANKSSNKFLKSFKTLKNAQITRN